MKTVFFHFLFLLLKALIEVRNKKRKKSEKNQKLVSEIKPIIFHIFACVISTGGRGDNSLT